MIVLACIVVAGGVYAFLTISIDAFPDVTTILVQVVAKAPGLSPAEMERFVTFPIELQLRGSPGLVEVRSLSKVGLAMIDVIFKDSMDIYLARQVVMQRLLESATYFPPAPIRNWSPTRPDSARSSNITWKDPTTIIRAIR